MMDQRSANFRDLSARAGGAHDDPFAWWGPIWTTPTPRSVLDLIGDDTLSVEVAALLWALLARRASIVVAAGPSGAGKTTLLTALLDFLPQDTRRVYLRGCYEPFAFLTDPAADPRRDYLLVNEISAHLPTYLWGPGVRRALGAVRAGYGLAATAHATTVEEFVYRLAGYPLRVPATEIAALDLVLLLDAWREGDTTHRQVAHLVTLTSATGGGIRVDPLATRPARQQPLALNLDAAAPCCTHLRGDPATLPNEVRERAKVLNDLVRASSDRSSAPADLTATFGALGARWLAAPNIG